MRWARTMALAACVAAGCSARGDEVERELEALRREIAELQKRPAVAAAPRVPAPAGNPAGPPRIPAAPDPSAPPPLPVVKLQRIKADPFKEGREPTIRIGKKGREAPPVAKEPSGPLEFDRMDEHGNLVDREGRVVYKAGTFSPPIDTPTPEAPPDRVWEVADDPHASPAERVDRAMGVPRVDGVSSAPGAPQPGIRPLPKPRLREVVIREGELPDDLPLNRDDAIVVQPEARDPGPPPGAVGDPDEPIIRVRKDDYAPPRPARPPTPTDLAPVPAPEPPAALPEPEPEPAPTPAAPAPMPRLTPPPMPVVAPPAPVAPRPIAKPRSAPGPQRVIRQVAFKGAKDKRAKKLYEQGYGAFQKGDHLAARKKFELLLEHYYEHDLADNALYWLGETAYGRGEWLQALAWFQDLILRYPGGNKLPDAMLKSALCYARLGDASYAVKILTDVEALFPSQPVAEVARERRLQLSDGGP